MAGEENGCIRGNGRRKKTAAIPEEKGWRKRPRDSVMRKGREKTAMRQVPGYRYPGYSQRFPKRITGLHVAATFGLANIVRLMLGVEGVDPDSKDSCGQTPLWLAAEKGHKAIVKLQLGIEGIDPDSKNSSYGRTPLSRAAENGHKVIVKLLLSVKRVDPDSKDSTYGRTLLS